MSTLLQYQPMVGLAYEQYQQFNQDARMRALDDAHQRYLHDFATDLEEGIAKSKIAIARNLKREGLDLALIAKTTGLSFIEIERLD